MDGEGSAGVAVQAVFSPEWWSVLSTQLCFQAKVSDPSRGVSSNKYIKKRSQGQVRDFLHELSFHELSFPFDASHPSSHFSLLSKNFNTYRKGIYQFRCLSYRELLYSFDLYESGLTPVTHPLSALPPCYSSPSSQSFLGLLQQRMPASVTVSTRPWGFPGGSAVKNLPANAGDAGSSPGVGRSPGEGNGNPLLYSCLGNPMDRGAQWAIVPGVAKELDPT